MRLLAILLLLTPCLSAQTITNPKASLVDVRARQARNIANPSLAKALAAHSCVNSPALEPPQGRIVIPHHYLSGSSGPINPAEGEATRPYNALEARVTAGTNQWLASGNEEEARCALAQLNSWARARTLLDYDPQESSQAWYQVEWTLSSIGIANSVLVADPNLDPAQQGAVNSWLKDVAQKLLSYDKPNGNNHHYWRGLAAISVGVSTGDNSLYKRGVQTYKEAVDEIDERGAFPQEMARHENAVHYQGFALQPLILIAQFAEAQGLDLYVVSSHGRTLRDAIVLFGKAAADPALVRPYTQDQQKSDISSRDFAAEAFFVARFGAAGLPDDVAKSLEHHSWDSRIGGDPRVYVGR